MYVAQVLLMFSDFLHMDVVPMLALMCFVRKKRERERDFCSFRLMGFTVMTIDVFVWSQ